MPQPNISLTDVFAEFKDKKNIDKLTLASILEDVFRSAIKKKYGSDDNFDVIINPDKGDFEIYQILQVVPDDQVEDPVRQIALSEARKEDPEIEVGEEFYKTINISDFGRRAILAMGQNLKSKIIQLERDNLYKKYKDRLGELITVDVHQITKRDIICLDDENNELILPKNQTLPTDRFHKGDTVRAIVYKVDMKNNVPIIILSRTAPEFLERLFELEVPEIADGLITIKKIVRKPGVRAKVAVESYDDRIDPVGACVGIKGSRIQGIVRELKNENIDVINYSTNPRLYIQRALSPAKILRMYVDEDEQYAEVYLKPEEVAKAIGKDGVNIKLAMELTGYQIEIFREIEEEEVDIDIDEFREQFDDWIIDELKKIGLDTARAVLEKEDEFLINRTELEEEHVYDLKRVLKEALDKLEKEKKNK